MAVPGNPTGGAVESGADTSTSRSSPATDPDPGPAPSTAASVVPWWRNRHAQTIAIRTASVIVLFLVWTLASMFLSARLVPGPIDTFAQLYQNAARGQLQAHTIATLSRIVQGFALAMFLGTTIGLLMGLSRIAEKALDMWVMVALVIPSLCYIIVVFLWLGMSERSTVIAIALTSFPFIAINIWEGVKGIDGRLNDMARTLGADRRTRVRSVTIPQVMPYLVASTRFGFGLVWKVVVIAELLGRSDGIGFQLFYWFQLFNMEQVFAWTLYFTIIMVIVEVGLLKPLERRLFRWRPDARG